MIEVFFGLGGNLGDRAGQLRRAVTALAAELEITAVSSLYQSAPMYVTDQPSFLNMALGGRTGLAPLELLGLVKRLETELGRVPGLRFGPRAVDIDILFYGDTVLCLPELEIPHPRLPERAFVLVPLVEIAPGFRHPVLGQTVAALRAALPDDGVDCGFPLF